MNKQAKVSLVVSILGVALAIGAPLGMWLSQDGTALAATAEAPMTTESPERAAPAPQRDEVELVIYAPEVVIYEKAPSPRKSKPAARKGEPCKARDEGTRELVQGGGSVRTFTFCH